MIYEPQEDSFLLEEQVKKFSKGKNVLEIGCGSGIQLVTAKEAGALKVLGIDIDKESIEFCKKKNLNVIQSDLFEKVRGKFNLIIFNPPYLPQDEREDPESSKATTGGKNGDEIILRFLKEAKNYLCDDGMILLLISSQTPQNKIEKILKEKNLQKEIIAEESHFMEKLEVWLIKTID